MGLLVGSDVSPGVAPGDVVVPVTTDPGWTPLFIDAAVIVLQVGGELQHGNLVAWEYSKPLVCGFEDNAQWFIEGQIVEVNGHGGTV